MKAKESSVESQFVVVGSADLKANQNIKTMKIKVESKDIIQVS